MEEKEASAEEKMKMVIKKLKSKCDKLTTENEELKKTALDPKRVAELKEILINSNYYCENIMKVMGNKELVQKFPLMEDGTNLIDLLYCNVQSLKTQNGVFLEHLKSKDETADSIAGSGSFDNSDVLSVSSTSDSSVLLESMLRKLNRIKKNNELNKKNLAEIKALRQAIQEGKTDDNNVTLDSDTDFEDLDTQYLIVLQQKMEFQEEITRLKKINEELVSKSEWDNSEEIDSLKQQIEHFRTLAQDNENKINSLQEEQNHNSDLSTEIEALKQQITELNTNTATTEERKKELELEIENLNQIIEDQKTKESDIGVELSLAKMEITTITETKDKEISEIRLELEQLVSSQTQQDVDSAETEKNLEVNSLRSELESLQQSKAEIESKLHDVKGKFDELQDVINQRDVTITELESKIQEMETVKKELEVEMESAKSDILLANQAKDREITNLKEELENAFSTRSELETRLETQISNNTQSSETEQANFDLMEAKKELENEISLLNAKQAEENSSKDQIISELKTEISELTQSKSELENEISLLQAKQTEENSSKDQIISELKTEISELTQSKNDLETEISSLKSTQTEDSSKDQIISELKTEISELTQSKSELENKILSLTTEIEIVQSTQENPEKELEIKALNEQIVLIQKAKSQLDSDYQQFKLSHQTELLEKDRQLSSAKIELESIHSTNEQIINEKDQHYNQVKSQFDTIQTMKNDLESQVDTLLNEIREMKSTQAEIDLGKQKEIEKLTHRIDELTTIQTDLTTQITTLQTSLQENQSNKSQIEVKDDRITQLKNEKDALVQKSASFKSEIDRLTIELNSAKSIVNTVSISGDPEIAKLQTELENVRISKMELEKSYKVLTTQMEDDKKLMTKLKNATKKLKNEKTTCMTEKNAYEQKVLELNKLLSERSVSNNNEEQMAKFRTEIKVLSDNLNSQQNQLKHEKEVNEVLLKQVDQSKQQCSLYKSQIGVNEKTIESLGLSISNLQGNSSGVVEECNTLKTTLGDQNKLIDNMKGEILRTITERDEMQIKVKTVSDEKVAVEGQLAKIKKLLSKSYKESQNKEQELLKLKGLSTGVAVITDTDTFEVVTCRLVNNDKWYLLANTQSGKELWLKEDDVNQYIASHTEQKLILPEVYERTLENQVSQSQIRIRELANTLEEIRDEYEKYKVKAHTALRAKVQNTLTNEPTKQIVNLEERDKLREYKKQIDDKQEQNQQLNSTLVELKAENEKLVSNNESLELAYKTLNEKCENQKSNYEKQIADIVNNNEKMYNSSLSSTHKMYDDLKKDYNDLSSELKKVHEKYNTELREKNEEMLKLRESIPTATDPNSLLPIRLSKDIRLELPPALLAPASNENAQSEEAFSLNSNETTPTPTKARFRPAFRDPSRTVDRSADLLAFILNENQDMNNGPTDGNEMTNASVEELFAVAAQNQMKTQNEVVRITKELETTKIDNDELKRRIKLLQSQERVLKEELRRVAPDQSILESAEIASNEYLKNIIINYITSKSDNEKRSLIPVLTTLLSLNSQEVDRLRNSMTKGLFSLLS